MAIFFGTFVLACKKPRAPESNSVYGFAAEGSNYLWPNATAEVCWEKMASEQEDKKWAPRRKKIEQLVTSEMQKAGFTLKGWGFCHTESRGIRVKPITELIGPASGRVQGIGRTIDGVVDGVKFLIEYNDKQKTSSGCKDEEICVFLTALHEFGHAIGLLHEHSRPDSPCSRDVTIYGDGGLSIGQFDPLSIMNYCASDVSNQIEKEARLSQGDLEAIKNLYGKKMIFPNENACEKNGFKWVVKPIISCCDIGTAEKDPASVTYPICEKEAEKLPPQSSKPEPQPTPTPPEPEAAGKIDRWKNNGFLTITIKEPFSVGESVLYCKEGQFLGEMSKSIEGLISVNLIRNVAINTDSFNCYQLDVLENSNLNSSSEKNKSKRMARMVFAQQLIIPFEKFAKFDLSGEKWTFFDVGSGSFPADTKVPNLSIPDEGKFQKVGFILNKNKEPIKAIKGTIFCGKNEYQGVASYDTEMSKDGNYKALSHYIFFKVPLGAPCTGLRLQLLKFTDAEMKTTGGTVDVQVEFDKVLQLPGNNQILAKSLTLPTCIYDQQKVPPEIIDPR
jgi:hypothetical protein